MPVERDGHFQWPLIDLIDGIRQDVSEGVRRYRRLKNFNWRRERALTKDLGAKLINAVSIGTATQDTLAGFHALYRGGTHALIVFQDTDGQTEPYTYNASTNAWTLDTAVDFADHVRPFPLMFANQMIVLDGGTLRARDSAGSWTTPGGSEANACTFGVVYAGRLIVAGNSSNPFTFYPSDVRDASSWDTSISQNVVGTVDEISALGRCGSYMIVGGKSFTRAYYLGTEAADDWDQEELSAEHGPVNAECFVSVPKARGSAQSASFFWSPEGPMMLLQQGQGVPSLHALWDPLQQFVAGNTYEGIRGIDLSSLDTIQGVWVPEYREVRWSIRTRSQLNESNPRNDILLCTHVDRAIAFGLGEAEYPYFRIRDNENTKLPCSTVFTARMDPADNDPDANYPLACMIAENGKVYHLDAKDYYTDNGVLIPVDLYVDGLSGEEDGVRTRAKSIRKVQLETSRPGSYNITASLYSGGKRVDQQQASLSGGGYTWSSDASVATWNGGKWTSRAQYGEVCAGVSGRGKNFAVQIEDEGSIIKDFHIISMTPMGYVEEQIK